MRCGLGSVRAPRAARGHPLVPGLEARAKPAVVDPQIAVTTPADRVRPYRLHLLGHHADIDLIAPIVLKAIQANAVGHRAKLHEIVLEPDIGRPGRATGRSSRRASGRASRRASSRASG